MNRHFIISEAILEGSVYRYCIIRKIWKFSDQAPKSELPQNSQVGHSRIIHTHRYHASEEVFTQPQCKGLAEIFQLKSFSRYTQGKYAQGS